VIRKYFLWLKFVFYIALYPQLFACEALPSSDVGGGVVQILGVIVCG